MRRYMNGQAPALMANLHTDDPERQTRNLNFDIDEAVQSLAVYDPEIRNREGNTFGVGIIGHDLARPRSQRKK